MELTFARGTLTDEFREEVDAFYGSVFGWKATDTDVVGQRCHILLPDAEQFILLAESKKPMSSPGFDHLGLLQDTRAEVDDLLDACKRYRDEGRSRADPGVRGPGHSRVSPCTPST